MNGSLATDLRELDRAAHSIQFLTDTGTLDKAQSEEIYDKIETRQESLLRRRRRAVKQADARPMAHSVATAQAAGTALPQQPFAVSVAAPAASVPAPPAPIVIGPIAPVPPPKPRVSWGQMFARFMEERNILWGELVGGMLIVGCSIALVISLWQTLEQIPYFPFLLFAAITGATFGAGLYTLGHWKLEATSRALLVIVTMLVPLDFLVLTRVTQGSTLPALDGVVQFVAAAIFAWMTHRALRILIGSVNLLGCRQAAGMTTAAIIGAAACQLLVPHGLDLAQPHPAWFVLLSMTPVLCHALAQGAVLIGLTRRGEVTRAGANVLLLTLGMTTFAAGVALGFMLHWSDDQVWTLRHLAVPLALLALPLVGVGALLSRRLASSEGESGARGLAVAQCRVAGTVIALQGTALMIGALALGWPRPPALVGIGLLNAAALVAVALTYRLPAAHVPALASLTIAFVTGYSWLLGALAVPEEDLANRLLHLAGSAESGVALTVLAGLVALFSEWLQRRQRAVDAWVVGCGSGVLAMLALCLAVRNGRMFPATSAWIEAIVGLGILAANMRWRRPWLSVAASVVILGAFNAMERAAGLEWSPSGASPTWLLGHATVMLAALWLPSQAWVTRTFALPLGVCGTVTSVVAVMPLAVSVTGDTLAPNAGACLWLASIWFAFAGRWRHSFWFAAGQLMLTAATLLGLYAWLEVDAELMRSRSLDLQAAGVALAVLSLAWTGVRAVLPPSSRWHKLLHEFPWAIDQIVLFVVLVGQLACVGAALEPFIAGELLLGQPEPILFSQTRAWLLLGILAATFTLRLWQPRVHETSLGWIVIAASGASLPALAWHDANSVTAALRWGLALAFLATSTLLWLRDSLKPWAWRAGIAVGEGPQGDAQRCRVLTLLLTVLPVLMLTTMIARQGFAGASLPAPTAGTWFALLGWVASMVTPLGLIVLGLIGHAVREEAPGYVFAAGLVTLAAVPGGYALGLITSGTAIDAAATVFIGQLAAVTASLWLLGWLATRRWRSVPLLWVQALLAGLFQVILLGSACAGLLVALDAAPYPFVEATAHWLGWISLFAWLVARLWLCDLTAPGRCVHALGIGGLGVGVLAACVMPPFDAAGWLSYHTLTMSWTLTALVLLVAAWVGAAATGLGPLLWPEERRAAAVAWVATRVPQSAARRWVEALCALVLLLALGGAWGDPARPYGSCAAVLAVSVLCGALAIWSRRAVYVYVSGLLVNFAAYLIWQAWLVDVWGVRVWFLGRPELFDRFLLLQALACAAGSAAWSLVEMALRHREPAVDLRNRAIPFAYAAALAGLQLLAIYVLVGIGANLLDMDLRLESHGAWTALAALAAALALGFWDPEARHWCVPAAPLYVAGLLGVGLGLHQAAMPPRELAWWAGLALGGYALAVTVLTRLRVPMQGWCGWPPQSVSRWADWFVPMQTVIGLAALGLSLWMVNAFPSTAERLTGALVAAMIAGAAWGFVGGPDLWSSRAADTRGPGWFARQGLLLGLLVAAEGLWAFVDPTGPAPWLQRTAGLFIVLAVGAWLIGAWMPRKAGAAPVWATAAAQLGRPLAWLSAVMLALLFVGQLALYDPATRATPLDLGLMLAVAAVLGACMVGAIVVAVAPRWDPFGLSERGKMMSVWLAELLLALTFLHLRLNVPDLIPSVLGKNWAFVLMTLGFVGIGLGELFQRRDLPMLAEPLFRTGLVLPLVPLGAYLLKPLVGFVDVGEAVPGLQPLLRYLDRLPAHFAVHAGLWFLLGMLYGLTAVLRRSSWFALAAALAGNFGLWVIYAQHPDLAFALHPQLWLGPLGVLVLVAERLHGESLTPGQAQAARYVGLLLIYVASSFDMFIHGLGNSVLLPIVLAVLAVLGVLAGILWRVRAFLTSGLGFLGLVIFAQIWHAAVQRGHVWVWWASGLVLGAAIFALFALFEKRRNDVVRLLDDFRQWQ